MKEKSDDTKRDNQNPYTEEEQTNGQQKTDKKTNNNLENTTQKTKEQHKSH
jgi:hypothetical protein